MSSYGFLVPAFNEEKIIKSQIHGLHEFLGDEFSSYEIIVVENGSRDRTPELLDELENEIGSVTGYNLEEANYGKALREGVKQTRHEKNFILNLDFWDTEFIKNARDELDDYDLIVGTKSHPDSLDERSSFRKFLTWGLNTLLSLLVGFEGTDTHGLKAFRKDSIQAITNKIRLNRGMFDTEMVIRAQKEGKEIKELPINLEVDRAPRNWMIKKILQNVVDITRLTWIIHREYR